MLLKKTQVGAWLHHWTSVHLQKYWSETPTSYKESKTLLEDEKVLCFLSVVFM